MQIRRRRPLPPGPSSAAEDQPGPLDGRPGPHTYTGPERRHRTRRQVMVTGLNYFPEQTGIAPYTTGLARHLVETGDDVVVVTGYPHYPEWRIHDGWTDPRGPEQDEGVTVVRVAHPVPGAPTGVSRIVMEAVFAVRSGAMLWRNRSDVVLAVSPALLSLAPAVLLKRVRRHAVGVVVQDLYGAALAETGIGGGALTRATAALELFLLRNADGVAVIHPVFRDRLVAAGVPAERVTVIPNWTHVTVPDVDRAEARAELGWAPHEFVVLHAGNMGVKQGLETLVDAARLAETRESSLRFVLLGDGNQRRHLEEYASGAARLGFLDPLPPGRFERALAAADCLILNEKPGVREMSVPSKLTTYFSSGRPVVAATHEDSGAAQLVEASGAGLRVDSGDPAALLNLIDKLSTDPALGLELGQAGQRYAAEHLSSAASLDRYRAWTATLVRRARRVRRRDDD